MIILCCSGQAFLFLFISIPSHIQEQIMFGIRFIKAQPTTYILQYRKGRVAREGPGLAFFYYAPTTSLLSVPMASTDVPFIFNEITADFQEISIQGQVTYRITDAKKVAQLLNFTLDPLGRNYVSDDPGKLPQRVINVVKVLTRKEIQKLSLREALRASDTLVPHVTKGLAESTEVMSLGLEILGLSILAIKPTPETARALEAETREKLFRDADEAVYARRNSAGEQETPDPRNPDGRRSGGAGEEAYPAKRSARKQHRLGRPAQESGHSGGRECQGGGGCPRLRRIDHHEGIRQRGHEDTASPRDHRYETG